jgi:hypothetical protein
MKFAPTPERREYLLAALEYGTFLLLPRDLYSKKEDTDDMPTNKAVMLQPVIDLTPGRCSSCGRFIRKDFPPDVWSVDVAPADRQMAGLPNIWARTHCEGCRFVTRPLPFARIVPMERAVGRARILGQI